MNKKTARGARFREGQAVRSLRETDAGATGVVVSLTKRQKAWCCNVMMDATCRVVTRREDELAPHDTAGSAERRSFGARLKELDELEVLA